MSRAITAYLGLGSNLGDRQKQMEQALNLLHAINGIQVTRCSSLYESAPVGFLDQPMFYNAVAEIHTSLQPQELLKMIGQIEHKLHRVRKIRFGPRTIDIDILLYEDLVVTEDNLKIPHPRMVERAFVLIPLRELVGNRLLPRWECPLDDCIRQLPEDQELRCIGTLWKEGLDV